MPGGFNIIKLQSSVDYGYEFSVILWGYCRLAAFSATEPKLMETVAAGAFTALGRGVGSDNCSSNIGSSFGNCVFPSNIFTEPVKQCFTGSYFRIDEHIYCLRLVAWEYYRLVWCFRIGRVVSRTNFNSSRGFGKVAGRSSVNRRLTLMDGFTILWINRLLG